MSTPREVFMQAMKTVLEGMTGIRLWGGSYLNPPFVELLYTHPELQNRHPYIGLVEMEGSRVQLWSDHDGREDDDFEIGLYGQMKKTPECSAREWTLRLRDDCKSTIKAANRFPGPLFQLPGVMCAWVIWGEETFGASDDGNYAEFRVPVTARLTNYLVSI